MPINRFVWQRVVCVWTIGVGMLGSHAVAQPGDACSSPVVAGNGFTQVDTVGATTDGPLEPGCMFVGGAGIERDVWFRYRATCGGMMTVDLCGVDFDSRVAVYSAPCPTGAGTALACDDDGCGLGGAGSRIEFAAVAGSDYLIRVGGFAGATGQGTMIVTCLPNNDSCMNARDLCTLAQSSVQTLIGATNDGEGCGISSGSADVWYTFTAPWDATLTISTCGSSDLGGIDLGTDTVLLMQTGCPGTGEVVLECNDDLDVCAGLDQGVRTDSYVSQSIMTGQTVLVRVAHFGEASPGNFVLNIDLTAPPNDMCAGATSVVTGSTPYCTFAAGTDWPGGPDVCPMNRDVWFVYDAPCSGPVRVSLCDSNFDSMLAAYTDGGGGCGALQLVAGGCNDNDGPACAGSGASIAFAGVTGTRYWLRVGAAATQTGSGVMNITCASVCEADWDGSGLIDSADFFAFLTDLFAGNADFNHDGFTNSQDFFEFLAAFFAGC